jgi:hypothetical protein
MEKNTQLSRQELTRKANGWILSNQQRWAEIRSSTKYPYQYLGKILESMYGVPVWRESTTDKSITGSLPTKKDPGVRFRLEDAGNGRVKYKSIPTRRATRGGPTQSSSGTRQFTERITSPPGTDFADSERRMGEANSRGMDGGHITPLDRQRAGQVEAVERGRTVQEYQSNFQKAGIPFGHTRQNIEDQTPEDNRVRQRQDYSQLDNNLRALEIKSGVRKPTKSKPKQKGSKGVANTTTNSTLQINGVPVARIGTLQGGGYRVDLDPFSGASIMIP